MAREEACFTLASLGAFSPLPVRSGGSPYGCRRVRALRSQRAARGPLPRSGICGNRGAAPRQPPPSGAGQGALRRGGCELCASQSRSENSGFRALLSFPFVARLQIGSFFYILRRARANVATRVLEALAVSTAGNGQGGPASSPCT